MVAKIHVEGLLGISKGSGYRYKGGMYIHETLTRRATNKTSRSVRLVEGSKAQRKTLLNLGANFAIPKAQWAELVEIIKAKLADSELFVEPAAELTEAAETIVQKLRSRGLVQSTDETLDVNFADVLLGSVEMENGRSVGCERIALASLDALGLHGVLKDVGLSDHDARITMALVIARMIHPTDEEETLRWLEINSSTLELLHLDTGQALKLDNLFRLNDSLDQHRQAIEDALFAHQRKLFGSSDAVVFHYLTNTHMTGQPASDLAASGRSTQKQNDCPVVTLALATDEGGFPRRSSVLPGDVSEPGTLLDALDSLATEGEDKPTVILDADIVTEDNLAELRNRGYHWITIKRGGVRPDQVDAVNPEEPDSAIETEAGHEAQVWKLSHEHENEAQLCIWSQARQEKEEAILAKKHESFETDLANLHDGLSMPRGTKKYDKVLARIGRLRERYAMVNHHYDITVTKAPDGKASAVTWKRNPVDTRDARAGRYVLRTSHTEWSVEDTVRIYERLTEMEATVQSLKSELGLPPVWHQPEKRIKGHLFIAVLALYGVNAIRTRLAAQGIHDKWATLRNKLSRWMRGTTTFTTTDGSRVELRSDSRPDPVAAAIAEAAGTPYTPDRRIRKLAKP